MNDPSDTIFEILIVEDKFKVQIMFRNLDAVSQLPEIKNVLIHHMDVKVVSPKLLNLIQLVDCYSNFIKFYILIKLNKISIFILSICQY